MRIRAEEMMNKQKNYRAAQRKQKSALILSTYIVWFHAK